MSVTLEDALRDVELEPGRTYHCRVGGHWVELRVAPDGPLDPWVELPEPTPAGTTRARPAPPDPPDVPPMPAGDAP